MTAKIVEFPKKDGNGAREALRAILADPHMRMPLGDWDVPVVADYLLACIWEAGFKVVPVKEPDGPIYGKSPMDACLPSHDD